jgi:hypothetical protein
MKRTIFVIVFLILLISIPMLAESNDSTQVNLENIVTQNQELKLPWYKTLKYEFGYTGAACVAYGNLKKSSGLVLIITPDLLFNWLNSVNVNVFLPSKSRLAIGVEYGWFPHLKERVGLLLLMEGTDYVAADKWAIFYSSILLKYYKTKSFYYGISINHFIANTEEVLKPYETTPDTTAYVQRECIGCGIFCGWEKHISFKGLNIYPFLKLQIGHAVEYHNNSPWEWGSKKLMIGTSGIFLGVNIRFGGRI